MEMEWQDPPKRKGGSKSKWIEAAQALKDNPNRWARLATKSSHASASAFATDIKSGAKLGFSPGGAFEAVTRLNGSGVDVFARYVGAAQPEVIR